MAYIIACLMASLSFIINRFLVKHIGPKVIISSAPALEEMAKTVLAYLLQADILMTHTVFGVIEAGYDYKNSKRHKVGAAIASIAGHTLFGIITVFILDASGSLMLSLLSAYAVHLGWNVLAVLINARRKDRAT